MIDEPVTPPRMKMRLPQLSNAELAELVNWVLSLELRHGVAMPAFCKWLAEATGNEVARRSGDGQREAGSLTLPALSPFDCGMALIVLTARTYGQQSEKIAAFFDETLKHVVGLACVQLSEFQNLCDHLQSQNGSEADGN